MTSTDLHTEPATARLAPVAPKDRVFNLDMLRGWAILGILAVNAIAFAWPSLLMMAEAPPPANTTQADVIGVWVIDVFFSDKMRTLFTDAGFTIADQRRVDRPVWTRMVSDLITVGTKA